MKSTALKQAVANFITEPDRTCTLEPYLLYLASAPQKAIRFHFNHPGP